VNTSPAPYFLHTKRKARSLTSSIGAKHSPLKLTLPIDLFVAANAFRPAPILLSKRLAYKNLYTSSSKPDTMELEKHEIKTEVEKSIRMCQEIMDDGQDIDIDDIQHMARMIQLALMRVNKDLL
jgi:hypothetical protein